MYLTPLNACVDVKEAQQLPILFIGHSLGGIVIKEVGSASHHVWMTADFQHCSKALAYAHARSSLFGDILRCTKTIFFFGTPHQGSDSANWVTFFGKLTQGLRLKASEVTTELNTWSNPLVDLTARFSEIAPDIAITTFFETADIHGVRVCQQSREIPVVFILIPFVLLGCT